MLYRQLITKIFNKTTPPTFLICRLINKLCYDVSLEVEKNIEYVANSVHILLFNFIVKDIKLLKKKCNKESLRHQKMLSYWQKKDGKEFNIFWRINNGEMVDTNLSYVDGQLCRLEEGIEKRASNCRLRNGKVVSGFVKRRTMCYKPFKM